jgi:hypothetical protein
LADRALRAHRSDDRNKALPTNVGLRIIMSILLFAFCALLLRKKIG